MLSMKLRVVPGGGTVVAQLGLYSKCKFYPKLGSRSSEIVCDRPAEPNPWSIPISLIIGDKKGKTGDTRSLQDNDACYATSAYTQAGAHITAN